MVGRGRRAIATLIVWLAPSGCLSDLTPPPGFDGGGPGGSDGGAGDSDGGVQPKCDPAGPFGVPEPLETVGGSINDGIEQGWPRVSRDGLTLYLVRADTRDGGRLLAGEIVFLSRSDVEDEFGAVATVETEFNPATNNDAPSVSADGLSLYYSDHSDSILVTAREEPGDLFPYPGELLHFDTDGVRDMHPYVVGDTLYFTSSRDGPVDDLDVYRANGVDDRLGAPGPMNLQTEGPGQQIAPVVSSDHRVVFFSADGTLHRAVRQPNGEFDVAAPADDLNDGVSYAGSLSADDCVLYFHTNRRAGTDFDIWMARATVTFEGD